VREKEQREKKKQKDNFFNTTMSDVFLPLPPFSLCQQLVAYMANIPRSKRLLSKNFKKT